MTSTSRNITILGCGIVGGATANLLDQQRATLKARTGIDLSINHIVVRRLDGHPNQQRFPLGTDALAAINDSKTDIVVELIGGTTTAREYITAALKLGKPVVTANKSLIAAHGPELFALARKHKTTIAFEASCGGGIPIIHALTNGLIANNCQALVGIVNGTCNFILSQMTRNGWSYGNALKEAQNVGFAEADPTLDVSGRDSAQKLAILAGLAFNVVAKESDISVEGIDTLQADDIGYACDLGYVIKLLAIAERGEGDRVALRVHPTLVHNDDQLAKVFGGFNAISFYGHALGHAFFYGRGAGPTPTASAVVADIVGVALGTAQKSFEQLRFLPDQAKAAKILPIGELKSRYYLRLSATDEPGVLAQVTAALGRHGISVAAVLQREPDGETKRVPVVITTHLALEANMRAALHEIDALATIAPPTVCLRILDQPKEFA